MKGKNYELKVLDFDLAHLDLEKSSKQFFSNSADEYYIIPSRIFELLMTHLNENEHLKKFNYIENFLQIASALTSMDGERIPSKIFKHVSNDYCNYLDIFRSEFVRKAFSRTEHTCFLYKLLKTNNYSLVSLTKISKKERTLNFTNELPITHASNNSLYMSTLRNMELNLDLAIRREIGFIRNQGEFFDTQRLISRLNKAFNFIHNRHICLGDKVNRIYGVNVSSITRNCLRIDGKPFVGLDISNCQPLLLNILLSEDNQEIDKNYLSDSMKGKIYGNLLNKCKRLGLKEDKIFNSDKEEFEIFSLEKLSDIKILLCRSILFDQKTEKESNLVKAFKSLYPKTFMGIEFLCKKYSSLAEKLQNLEASIIVEQKFDVLIKNQINYFTLHDCIYFKQVDNWEEIAEILKNNIIKILSKMSKGKITEAKFKISTTKSEDEANGFYEVINNDNSSIRTFIINEVMDNAKNKNRIREKSSKYKKLEEEMKHVNFNNSTNEIVKKYNIEYKSAFYYYLENSGNYDFSYKVKKDKLEYKNNITCTKIEKNVENQEVVLDKTNLKKFKKINFILAPYFQLVDSVNDLAKIDPNKYKPMSFIRQILKKEENNLIDYEKNSVKSLSFEYNEKLYCTLKYKKHAIDNKDKKNLNIKFDVSFYRKDNDKPYDVIYQDYKLAMGEKYERLNETLFYEEDNETDLRIYNLSEEVNLKDFEKINLNLDFYYSSLDFLYPLNNINPKFKNIEQLEELLNENKDKILDIDNNKINFFKFEFGDDLIGSFEYRGHYNNKKEITITMLFEVRSKDGEIADVEDIFDSVKGEFKEEKRFSDYYFDFDD